ncbi:MAG TPA: sigma-70 family RNA polymerase sigma factor [Myxococcota bacterium]|nr:sigma-70 family RNA polymerase sigma factor [Myxococcota bacterium]
MLEISALYKRYAKLVHGLALAILGSPDDADDLVQEIFVSLLRGAQVFDPARGTMSSFLITLTRSRALDRLRARHRSARLLASWHESAPPEAPPTPFERVAAGRAARRMRAGVSQLPEPQRRVLELAYWCGLSQAEIALDLGAPLGTVKSLSRRALDRLRQSLAPASGVGDCDQAPYLEHAAHGAASHDALQPVARHHQQLGAVAARHLAQRGQQ